VPDPRARRGLPERWLLPPAPREAELAARWVALPFERRRQLAHVRPDEVAALSGEDAAVVGGLARARLATSWRLLGGAPLLGWLVLMTVWGFGRSTAPDAERAWLLAGVALGAGVWFATALWTAGRLRRSRRILGELAGHEAA
jgi:fatty acid desaturase